MTISAAWNHVRTSPLRRLYERLPPFVRHLYGGALHLPSRTSWRLRREGKVRAEQVLAPLRDRFRGHRAVLLGNGPSLRRTDWDRLRDEFVFGTNRIYLIAREGGVLPDVYVCINALILRQFGPEIEDLPCLKVIDWFAGRGAVSAGAGTAFLRKASGLRFCTDVLEHGWSHGYTVTYAALQLAYFMGFSQVVLIGVDHRFHAAGAPMREVVAKGPDRDHFTPDYFPAGIRWQLPNLDGSLAAYRLADAAYRADGRSILDATDGGALDVFPKESLDRALTMSAHPPPPRAELPLELSRQPDLIQ